MRCRQNCPVTPPAHPTYDVTAVRLCLSQSHIARMLAMHDVILRAAVWLSRGGPCCAALTHRGFEGGMKHYSGRHIEYALFTFWRRSVAL